MPKHSDSNVSAADKKAVADDYQTLNDALVSGDVTIACRHMTGDFLSDVMRAYGGKFDSCADIVHMSKAYNQANPSVRNNKIGKITIRGDEATLVDKTPVNGGIQRQRIYLIYRDRIWSVDHVQTAKPHYNEVID